MDAEELLALLRLQALPYIGDIMAKRLLQKFGSAEAVFNAKKKDLLQINGFGEKRLQHFTDITYLKKAEKEVEFIERNTVAVHYFKDKGYPELLKQCIDAPILLFAKGNIDLKQRKIISIVGTRKATVHGTGFVEEIIKDLAPLNPVIVSGFAYGIDISAHKAALENGLQTLGCMAHGLDMVYPKQHEKYRVQVAENGGFITDFWSNAVFDRNNFLKRNRIIAGISEATIVVESARKGGALVTADIANSYDRDVFAVPGRPTDKMSVGCNTLLKTHQAQAITSAEDIIYLLNWDIEQKEKPKQTALFIELSSGEKKVVEALKRLGKAELDDLAIESGLPSYKVASVLLNLELNNVIRTLPGKQYEAI